MTIYQGMDIGTDKPTLDPSTKVEKDGHYIIKGVRHHMLDRFSPDEEFNVSIFKDMVEYEVSEIHKRGNIPFLIGGSLFYIDAFCYDYSLPLVVPDKKLREQLEQESSEELWEKLVKLDPDAEWTVDPKNRRRVIRALEVCLKTGKPFTTQKKRKKIKDNVLYLVTDGDRKGLYRKINKRVDEMMDMGLLEEVKSLFEKYDHNTAMQATGYRQIIEYLDGKISLDKAVENTKRSHRNFAKRQLTWLKKNQDKALIKNSKEAKQEIEKFLKGF
jgi:tRNA dimethylallyltransferase